MLDQAVASNVDLAAAKPTTIPMVCLVVELAWIFMWAMPLMFGHKALFKAFKLEQHGLAEVLIKKDNGNVFPAAIRGAWCNIGQLLLVFGIVAIVEMCQGDLQHALLTTTIYQISWTLFSIKDQVINPYGMDEEFIKNTRVRIVVLFNVALSALQYYGYITFY
eukprot:NODE_3952_length_724_cov_656.991031.p1 GENE.NODE_3952_length_724_cov_656.991031~~NODE_3952_length_724_cov_656.991031.p1  ORF type:complete len:190 (-),score=56.14 NODE_3952_length_724_cov_656.991031:140-628(-)